MSYQRSRNRKESRRKGQLVQENQGNRRLNNEHYEESFEMHADSESQKSTRETANCSSTRGRHFANSSHNHTFHKSNERRGKHRYQRGYNHQTQHEYNNTQTQGKGKSCRRYHSKQKSKGSQASQTNNVHQETSNTDNDIEIPGFYYDREKKKYFKILPNQNNVISSAITRESLLEKKNERIRLEKVDEMLGNKPAKGTVLLPTRTKQKCYTRFTAVCDRNIYGGTSLHRFENDVVRNVVSNLKPQGHAKFIKEPDSSYEIMENMTLMHPNSDYTKFLCLWSVKDLFVQRIQMLELKDIRKTKKNSVAIDLNPCGAAILQSFSKVTHMCRAPFAVHGESPNVVLYTTCQVIGNNTSLAMLRNLDSTSVEDYRPTEFNLGPKAAWTCAWNSARKQIGVGSEGSGLLLDVKTRKLWELFTNKEDVLSLEFTKKDGLMVFSGTRKGHIYGHDLRSNSTHFVTKFKHKTSIGHLSLMKDENYLIASDFSGKIKIWDLRKRKVVKEFKENENSYTKIPFHLDSSEQILYSAGSDSYTRFWDIQTGVLLQTLPPPYASSRDLIPSVCFSTSLGKAHPGLLMGIKDELHFYSV